MGGNKTQEPQAVNPEEAALGQQIEQSLGALQNV